MYLVKYICRLGVRDNCKRVSWWILSIYYKLKLKSNISELSPKYLEVSECTQLICPSFRHHSLITAVSPQQTTSYWSQALSIPKNYFYILWSPCTCSTMYSIFLPSQHVVDGLKRRSHTVMICFHLKSKFSHCFALTLIYEYRNVHHKNPTVYTE